MDDLTEVLRAIERGDAEASQKLFPLVYDELRRLATQRMADERPGQTLQATALVHEAYLRLVSQSEAGTWDHRGHFFAAAAAAMRRILVDNARRKNRLKRGGAVDRIDIPIDHLADSMPDERVLALDEALTLFEEQFPEKAAVVKLRYFAGLSNEQVAETLRISTATVQRYWTFARAWLFAQLRDGENE